MQQNPLMLFYGYFNGKHFLQISMEYLKCGTLYNLIVRTYGIEKKCFKYKAVKFIFLQILLALHYLHECKVAHRDIKPQNIGIDERGYMKLCDFGLSKQFELNTSSFCGTERFRAPEIGKVGTPYNHNCDIFSLGTVVKFLLEKKIFNFNLYFDEHHLHDLFKQLENLVFELLNVKPQNRPSAQDLIKRPIFDDIDLKRLLLQDYNMKIEIDFDAEKLENNQLLKRLKEDIEVDDNYKDHTFDFNKMLGEFY